MGLYCVLTVPLVTERDIDVDSEGIVWEYFQKERDIVNILKKNDRKIFQVNYKEHINMSKNVMYYQGN